MNTKDLKSLLERAETWPQKAQDELVQIGLEIEGGVTGADYHATPEELRAIDESLAELERGEVATNDEVMAAFAKFRGA